jgi:hypothetical protein
MLRYTISSVFMLLVFSGHGQNDTIQLVPPDSLVYTQPYGLRIGADLSRPARTFLDDLYSGFELVGDYRITQNLYLAAELGNEKFSRSEELGNENNENRTILYDYTTSGSYIKLGVDFNTYENWYGMNNTIFIGGRYAFSSHSQTLNSYRIYESNRYWNPEELVVGSELLGEYGGLNASWLEFVFGLKAEIIANFYLGASVRLGFLVSNKEAQHFPNLWIPGFNKVNEGSNFGAGYNYSLTYLIPLYRKSKKPNETISEEP